MRCVPSLPSSVSRPRRTTESQKQRRSRSIRALQGHLQRYAASLQSIIYIPQSEGRCCQQDERFRLELCWELFELADFFGGPIREHGFAVNEVAAHGSEVAAIAAQVAMVSHDEERIGRHNDFRH